MNGTRRSLLISAPGAALGGVALLTSTDAQAQTGSGPIRRVVTGHRNGKSVFLKDGRATHVYQRTAESVKIIELWETGSSPASNEGESDPVERPLRLEPPANGSIFRILEFLPETQQQGTIAQQRAAGDDGSGIVDAMNRSAGSRAPGFHKTDTVDYVIVLSGEIHALMDEGEVLLKTGDVLIQRDEPRLDQSFQPARPLGIHSH